MSLLRMVPLLAIAALPQLALADDDKDDHGQPANSPPSLSVSSLSNSQLGALQSVFDFCSRIDPHSDAAFDKLTRAMYQGVSDDNAKKIQNSSDFRNAYATLQSVLAEFPLADAVKDCEASI